MRAAANSSGASKFSFGTHAAELLVEAGEVKEGLILLLFAAVDVRRLAAPRFGDVTLEELAEVGREIFGGPEAAALPLPPHDAAE
jgi:hypothetical protein